MMAETLKVAVLLTLMLVALGFLSAFVVEVFLLSRRWLGNWGGDDGEQADG